MFLSIRVFLSVPEYTKISKTMQKYIHKSLKGEMTPKEALDKAASEINK